MHEDAGLSESALRSGLMGPAATTIILGVSNDKSELFSRAEQGQKNIVSRLERAQKKDMRIIPVTLADRDHNMLTLDGMLKRDKPDARQRAVDKAEETLNVHALMAEGYGSRMICDLLRDTALRVLEPRIFADLYDYVHDPSRLAQEKYVVEEARMLVEEGLRDLGLDGTRVFIRPRSYYALYERVLEKDWRSKNDFQFGPLELVYMVVTVPEQTDIYRVLNIVHAPPFSHIRNRFHDDLNHPRWNGLRGVKTTVQFARYGELAVSLFTPEMELFNRFGMGINFFSEGRSWFRKELPAISAISRLARSARPDGLAQEVGRLGKQVMIFDQAGRSHFVPREATVAEAAIWLDGEQGMFALQCRVNGAETPGSFPVEEGTKLEFAIDPQKRLGMRLWQLLKTDLAKDAVRKQIDQNRNRNYAVNLARQALNQRMLREMHSELKEISRDKTFRLAWLAYLSANGFSNRSLNDLLRKLGRGEYDFDAVWQACVDFYRQYNHDLRGNQQVQPDICRARIRFASNKQPGLMDRFIHGLANIFLSLSDEQPVTSRSGETVFNIEYYLSFQVKQIERILTKLKDRGVVTEFSLEKSGPDQKSP